MKNSNFNCTIPNNVTIPANGLLNVNFTGGSTCINFSTSGEKIQTDFTITYADPDGFIKTTTGDLIVRVA